MTQGGTDRTELRIADEDDQKRDVLTQAMSGRLTPELLAEYLEVQENQFLELVRPNAAKKRGAEQQKG